MSLKSFSVQIKRYFTFLILAVVILTPATAMADISPSSGEPATVSADALPTTQIGAAGKPNVRGTNEANPIAIAWAQVVVGNRVFVTGNFTKAQTPGGSWVDRQYLLAYDIRTGQLDTSFNVPLNDVGRALAASPDGTRLYVGGYFTSAGGETHNRIAAINLTTNQLVSGFNASLSGTVRTLVATNSQVYVGGGFQNASGSSRANLAAFSSSGSLLSWAPRTNRPVQSMVQSPTKPYIIFGGSFDTVNNSPYYSIGAVDATSGANVPWASTSSSFKLQNVHPSEGITISGLAASNDTIFASGQNASGPNDPSKLEGRAAMDSNTGAVKWINNCYGDTYDVFYVNNVLYSAGHSHDCSPVNGFPQTPASWTHKRIVAESATATQGCVNRPSTNTPYRTAFSGTPCSKMLNWYPELGVNSYLGQAAWSISGNSQYITVAGQFPTVNGAAQYGLTRFAVADTAPKKVAPDAFDKNSLVALPANANGSAGLRLPGTSDKDNERLTYRLYRDQGTTPIVTYEQSNQFWNTTYRKFTDTGLAANSVHTYRLTATDPNGNVTTINSITPSRYTALPTAQRITDTRAGSGYANAGKTIRGTYGLNVKVTGVGGVPANGVTAVVLNVTASNVNTSGFISVYTPTFLPNSSTLNLLPGVSVNNQTTVALNGDNVHVALNASSSMETTDVIIDVVGYYTAGSSGNGFTPLAPTRATDTRGGSGQANQGNRLNSGSTVKVNTSGLAGIPSNATSVIANVTTVGASIGGYGWLTLYPSGEARPNSSSMNFTGPTLTKEVNVRLGSDGSFMIHNATGSVDVIVDIAGYYTASGGSAFVPLSPTRIADTRSGSGVAYAGQSIGAGSTITIDPINSVASVPVGAKAVSGNLTHIASETGAYLVAYPTGTQPTAGTNITFSPSVAFNNATIKLGTNNSFTIRNSNGVSNVIIDLNGFYY